MRLIKGISLTEAQKAEVLRSFVYRHTIEHKPDWIGTNPALYATADIVRDEQWIRDHAFYIREDGRLAQGKRHEHCEPEYLAS